MIETEEWKDVRGFEGLYQISSFGRFKSLPRLKRHSGNHYITIKGKMIIGSYDGGGYIQVQLIKDGIRKQMKIHKLVAIHFLGHVPCGYKEVINHKDFNRINNHKNNLEKTTQRENANKKHLKSSSKYVGVYWSNMYNKWIARIGFKNKLKHLGYFINEIDAHLAYERALNNILVNGEIGFIKSAFKNNYKGVTFHKSSSKYMAQISINKKNVYIGMYKTEIEASNAYQKALLNIKK